MRYCFNGRVYEYVHTDVFDKVCKSDCSGLNTLCTRGSYDMFVKCISKFRH